MSQDGGQYHRSTPRTRLYTPAPCIHSAATNACRRWRLFAPMRGGRETHAAGCCDRIDGHLVVLGWWSPALLVGLAAIALVRTALATLSHAERAHPR